MAVATVRALLREAATIFEGIERTREPVLITRNGRPIAALVPVDPDQAESMVLSSMPEFIASRRDAESASAEGRTTPLETVLQALDAQEPRTPTRPAEAARRATAKPSPHAVGAHHRLPEITYLLGAERAEEVNRAASDCIRQITVKTLSSAAEAGLVDKAEQHNLAFRIEALNAQLFVLKLRRELVRDLLERLAAITAGTTPLETISNPIEGLVGKSLTDSALDEASTFVGAVNSRSIDSSRSSEVFEASLAASVGALELSDPVTK